VKSEKKRQKEKKDTPTHIRTKKEQHHNNEKKTARQRKRGRFEQKIFSVKKAIFWRKKGGVLREDEIAA
jgi:hypothetical protein